MRNDSDKSCRENQNTRLVFGNYFFIEKVAFYEIMWKNIVQLGRPQTTIQRMRIECWTTKATNTKPDMQYLFLFHFNNGYRDELQCYVLRKYIACHVTFCVSASPVMLRYA
jgi:hypothetical protein